VTAATPLSGGGGWLVWSAPVPGGYALMGYHDGTVRKLPPPTRPQPFDAEVGSAAGGTAVVTYSRCARVPRMRGVGEQAGAGGALLEPQTGRGCRVRVLDLETGTERSPPIPVARGASDTTPSMWKGTVTFARHDPRHGDVWQVLSWSPAHPRRLRSLPHGSIPSCPELPRGCTRPAHATVTALSSDGGVVAFMWMLPPGEQGIIGEGAWELRVDRADGSASAIAAWGFGHEECTAGVGNGHELEYVWPEPPIAAGGSALLPELYAFSCSTGFASVLESHGPAPGRGRLGKLETVSLALARDEGRLYGLVPSVPRAVEGDSPRCAAAAPCWIEQVRAPALKLESRAPSVPFQ